MMTGLLSQTQGGPVQNTSFEFSYLHFRSLALKGLKSSLTVIFITCIR